LYPNLGIRAQISKQRLARPEVHSWHQYTFPGSMTMVFASGIGLFPGQPQLRGKRRFERPRRGTDDQGRAARTRNGGTVGRLRRLGQSEARGTRGTSPRASCLSCGKLNDGRLPDGEMAANLEERDSQAVRSARATVPSGASCRQRFLGRGNPACGSIRNWAAFWPKCGRSRRAPKLR